MSNPSEQRIEALASGSKQKNQDFLRQYPNIKPWEYVNALGEDTALLAEPAKSIVRDIWFEHLKSRDAGTQSSYFVDLQPPISPPKQSRLVIKVFDIALRTSFPDVAQDLLWRNGGSIPSFPNGHRIDGEILHSAAANKSPLVLRDVLHAIGKYDSLERDRIVDSVDSAGRTALTIAVEKHDLESVKLLIQEQPHLLHKTWGIAKDTPLHSAIRLAENEEVEAESILGIIRAITQCSPTTLCARNVDGNPPYRCAQLLQSARPEVGTEVIKLLKNHIIDYLKDDIKKARRAFYGNSDKELGINFQDFNQPSHDFTRFINDLWTYRSVVKDLEFEDTLFYVILPDFCHHNSSQFHDEVKKLFDWLGDNGVKSIIDLQIPDSIENPMEDDFIQSIVLDRFYVTKLHWRKMDVNADVFTESEKSKISLKSLELYSSGNWSILYHWASKDGLKKCSEGKQSQYPSRLRTYRKQAKKLFEDVGLPCEVEIGEFTIAISNVSREDMIDTSGVGISREFKDCHDTIRAFLVESSPSVHNLEMKPVKVAIIDNGADKVRTTTSANIKEGISYVTSESGKYELPWWFVTDSHGAQMASLICEINPYCQLYIARVGKGRKDVNLNNAATAVEWAIARDVDIISISWTTTEKHDDLYKAIKKATDLSIIVICSTADEGKEGSDIYPAGWSSHVLSVSALDAAGRRRGASQKKVDILVLGEDVPANGPNYITANSNENVSGSSVATAVASGMASLLLVCTRLANMKPENWMYFRRRDEMLGLFKRMQNNDNHVKPSMLFGDIFSKSQPKDTWLKTFCHPKECIVLEGEVVEQKMFDGEIFSRSTTFHSTVSVQ